MSSMHIVYVPKSATIQLKSRETYKKSIAIIPNL